MELVVILYSAWAIYAGYRFMTGRSEWLERDAPLNKIAKIGISVLVGYIIGAFYLFYLIAKYVTRNGRYM